MSSSFRPPRSSTGSGSGGGGGASGGGGSSRSRRPGSRGSRGSSSSRGSSPAGGGRSGGGGGSSSGGGDGGGTGAAAGSESAASRGSGGHGDEGVKKQYSSLKKEIYEKWESSILRSSQFTPADDSGNGGGYGSDAADGGAYNYASDGSRGEARDPTGEREAERIRAESKALDARSTPYDSAAVDAAIHSAASDSRRTLSPPLPLYKKRESPKAVDGISPPKTGIAAPMMWPFPDHAATTSPSKGAPLIKPRDSIIAEMMARDAKRIMHPELVLNRVVYDSITPPPDRQPPLRPSGGATPEAGERSVTGSFRRSAIDRESEAVMEGTDSGATRSGPIALESADPNPGGVSVGADGRRFISAGRPQRSASPTVGTTTDRLPDWYTPQSAEDHTLVFESRFETGNVRRAIQVYEYEYDVIIKPDVNTRGHTQWFYFSVKNMRRGVKYKFNLINMLKPESLFNHGMQPCVRSEKMAALHGIGWVRRATDICYYQNHVKRRGGYYYTATFTMDFPYSDDTVYMAYCYPYTYTDLQRYLRALETDPRRKNRFRRRRLCYTLAGNTCDLLTITSFACDPEALKQRKGVVVSARVHPGESNASWMMKGFIDYLTGPSLDAKILRDNFVFKIVPMLNPDGVVVGNYRCSLAGVDLNRQWKEPSRRLHPTVYYVKEMIRRLCEDRDVIMYVDLHGHSRKRNIFMYGCENKPSSAMYLKERVFPRMLWRSAISFSFDDCNFKVQKAKESTARVVAWREIGLTNAYTMEASFCAPDFGKRSGEQFTVEHFEEMGHFFCDTILDYCDPDQVKVKATMRELETMLADRPLGADEESEDSLGSDDGTDIEDGKDGAAGGRRRKRKGKGKRKSDKESRKDRGEGGKSRGSKGGRSSKDAGSGSSTPTAAEARKSGSLGRSSSRGRGKMGSAGSGKSEAEGPRPSRNSTSDDAKPKRTSSLRKVASSGGSGGVGVGGGTLSGSGSNGAASPDLGLPPRLRPSKLELTLQDDGTGDSDRNYVDDSDSSDSVVAPPGEHSFERDDDGEVKDTDDVPDATAVDDDDGDGGDGGAGGDEAGTPASSKGKGDVPQRSPISPTTLTGSRGQGRTSLRKPKGNASFVRRLRDERARAAATGDGDDVGDDNGGDGDGDGGGGGGSGGDGDDDDDDGGLDAEVGALADADVVADEVPPEDAYGLVYEAGAQGTVDFDDDGDAEADRVPSNVPSPDPSAGKDDDSGGDAGGGASAARGGATKDATRYASKADSVDSDIDGYSSAGSGGGSSYHGGASSSDGASRGGGGRGTGASAGSTPATKEFVSGAAGVAMDANDRPPLPVRSGSAEASASKLLGIVGRAGSARVATAGAMAGSAL